MAKAKKSHTCDVETKGRKKLKGEKRMFVIFFFLSLDFDARGEEVDRIEETSMVVIMVVDVGVSILFVEGRVQQGPEERARTSDFQRVTWEMGIMTSIVLF